MAVDKHCSTLQRSKDGITARDSPIRRSSSHTRLRIDEQTKVTDIARPRVCLKSSVRALCTSRERISIIGPLMQRVNSCVLLPRLQKDFPCGLVVHRLPPAASIPGNKEQKSSAPESRSMCIRAVRCSFALLHHLLRLLLSIWQTRINRYDKSCPTSYSASHTGLHARHIQIPQYQSTTLCRAHVSESRVFSCMW